MGHVGYCLQPEGTVNRQHHPGRYCATHQELRELAVRGVDAPGLHVLDVCPESFKHLPGFPERIAGVLSIRKVPLQLC